VRQPPARPGRHDAGRVRAPGVPQARRPVPLAHTAGPSSASADAGALRLRRHLTSTAWSSYLGLTAVVVWAAVTVALVAAAGARGALRPMAWAPDWSLFGSSALEIAAQVFAVVPVLATAYTCQMTVMFVVRAPADVDAACGAGAASPALSAACAPSRSAPVAARAAAASAASAACLWAFRCVRQASEVRSFSTKA